LPQKELPENETLDLSNEPAEAAEFREVKAKLRELINGLPEKMRLTVLMFYASDMSLKQISREMRVPQGTVKSRLNAAKKILKEKMEECGYGN